MSIIEFHGILGKYNPTNADYLFFTPHGEQISTSAFLSLTNTNPRQGIQYRDGLHRSSTPFKQLSARSTLPNYSLGLSFHDFISPTAHPRHSSQTSIHLSLAQPTPAYTTTESTQSRRAVKTPSAKNSVRYDGDGHYIPHGMGSLC